MIDFLIIGGTKCGSTSLADFVSKSASVNFCRKKEPAVLNKRDLTPAHVDYYGSLFDDKPGLKGEATPAYSDFKQVDTVIRNLVELNARPKIVLAVRNQVKRIESHLMEMVKAGKLRPQDADQFFLNNFGNFTRGMFGHVAAKYIDAFGKDAVLVLNFDKLIASDADELKKCINFLGLEQSLPLVFPASNKTAGARKKNFLTRFYGKHLSERYRNAGLPSLKQVAPFIGSLVGSRILPSEKISLNADQIRFVNDFFRQDARIFKEITSWSYDELSK